MCPSPEIAAELLTRSYCPLRLEAPCCSDPEFEENTSGHKRRGAEKIPSALEIHPWLVLHPLKRSKRSEPPSTVCLPKTTAFCTLRLPIIVPVIVSYLYQLCIPDGDEFPIFAKNMLLTKTHAYKLAMSLLEGALPEQSQFSTQAKSAHPPGLGFFNFSSKRVVTQLDRIYKSLPALSVVCRETAPKSNLENPTCSRETPGFPLHTPQKKTPVEAAWRHAVHGL